MDNRRIGFCDSGLGGLTAVPFLQQLLPSERIVYFGDTARTPYGSRDVDTVKRFGHEIIEFLLTQDVKAIVIACNTLSATILPEIRQIYPDIPIIGMIEPTIQTLNSQIKAGDRLGIIGTQVTIESNLYPQGIAEVIPDLSTVSLACPSFVPMIEDPEVKEAERRVIVELTLKDFIYKNDLTHLLLGCTHYPLLAPLIRDLFPHLQLINPAAAVIEELENVLSERNALTSSPDLKSDQDFCSDIFFASDLSLRFRQMADQICASQHIEFVEKKIGS